MSARLGPQRERGATCRGLAAAKSAAATVGMDPRPDARWCCRCGSAWANLCWRGREFEQAGHNRNPRKLQVVAGVLIRDDGACLIAKRAASKRYGGCWEFPGGKVECGESDFAALSRELREELGVGISAASMLCEAPSTDGSYRNCGLDAHADEGGVPPDSVALQLD